MTTGMKESFAFIVLLLSVAGLSGWAFAADPPDSGETTAVGVGATPEDAQKDAISHAVQAVVGSFIDSQTQVKNDKIIEDKILSVSSGFVENSTDVVPVHKRRDGLYEVTVKAQVRRTKVREVLKEAKVISVDVDSKALAQSLRDGTQKVQDADQARQLLEKYVPELRARLLTARVIDERGKEARAPATEVHSDGTVACTWYLEVGYDKAYFDEVAPVLRQLLDACTDNANSGTVTLVAHPTTVSLQRRPVTVTSFASNRPALMRNSVYVKDDVDNVAFHEVRQGQLMVAINIGNGKDQERQPFRWYLLDHQRFGGLFEQATMPVTLSVDVLGADGTSLAFQTVPLSKALVNPYWELERPKKGAPPETGPVEVPLSNEFFGPRALGWNLINQHGRKNESAGYLLTPEFAAYPKDLGSFGHGSHLVMDRVVVRFSVALDGQKARGVRELKIRFANDTSGR